jgi:hypothetical protein
VKELLEIAVADVTLGYYSPTFIDGMNTILVARDPVSNLDQFFKAASVAAW